MLIPILIHIRINKNIYTDIYTDIYAKKKKYYAIGFEKRFQEQFIFVAG